MILLKCYCFCNFMKHNDTIVQCFLLLSYLLVLPMCVITSNIANLMLNWILEKLLRLLTGSSRRSSRMKEESEDDTRMMHQDGKLSLSIISEGEVWSIRVVKELQITDLRNMAVSHFNTHKLSFKYKLISISQRRVLNSQCTVQDEQLGDGDELLLMMPISIVGRSSLTLSLQDIQGPSEDDIKTATSHLKNFNPIPAVPCLGCQENNFSSDIPKVLYSLVGASAKILAQIPDAKVIFDGIAARINVKNKKESNEHSIRYLKDLGFTEVQARYALRLKRNRQGEAREWLLKNSHRVKEEDCSNITSTSTSDPVLISEPIDVINNLLQDITDFNYQHFEPSPQALETITAMGFASDDVVEALRITNNNRVAACEWLCGERGPSVAQPESGLDPDGPLFKALMDNPTVQFGLNSPKALLAFLSILENPSSATVWLNDVDTAPVLIQVFTTYHIEKHLLLVSQQAEFMKKLQK